MSILQPLYDVVSWIMIEFHALLAPLLGTDSGAAWALSIVGLVIVIRILLFPLFVKQIHAQRGLQQLQPQIKELQKKFKDDRERQSQEMMKLYKESGTNPFSSCLPLLLQAPIFYALFRVLDGLANGVAHGVFETHPQLVQSARHASIFGAQISAKFIGASSLHVQLVTVVLIVLMTLSTFTSQYQLMRKNMPASALTGAYAQQQKLLLYLFPLIFAVTGINFPIGVLIYWLTTNVWSMGQQFYVINRMPSPGTKAAEKKADRDAKRKKRGFGGAGGIDPELGGTTFGVAPAAGIVGGGSVSRLDRPGSERPSDSPRDTAPGLTPTDSDSTSGQRAQPRRRPKGKRSAPGSSGPGVPKGPNVG